MTRDIQYRNAALQDATQVISYLRDKGEEAALRYWGHVEATAEKLIDFPGVGHRFDTKSANAIGVRVIPVDGFHNHLIFYRYDDEKIEILRVLHGARDLGDLFDEDDDDDGA